MASSGVCRPFTSKQKYLLNELYDWLELCLEPEAEGAHDLQHQGETWGPALHEAYGGPKDTSVARKGVCM